MDAKSYLYQTQIEWGKRRRGQLQAEGLPALALAVSTPPEFNGEAGFCEMRVEPEFAVRAAAA